jgi:hypothetical protein
MKSHLQVKSVMGIGLKATARRRMAVARFIIKSGGETPEFPIQGRVGAHEIREMISHDGPLLVQNDCLTFVPMFR